MRILLVSGNIYLPQYSGGVESSTHELALALKERGHAVSVACKFAKQGMIGLRSQIALKATGKRYARDRSLGYPVYRYWNVAKRLAETIPDITPDVALVQIGGPVELATELRRAGVPTIVYLRNAEPNELGGDPKDLKGVRYLANSEFIARFYGDMFGIEADVIPPLFEPERYRIKRSPSHVLFINPAPAKGVDIALEIARRCPEIPFRLLKSWPMGEGHKVELRAQIKEMPNVSFKTRTSDPQKIYGGAKIVLVPSKWQEAWGRARRRLSSAAFRSSHPTAAGCQSRSDLVVFCSTLMVRSKPGLRPFGVPGRMTPTTRTLSKAALDYSKRPAIDPAAQINSLIELMRQASASP